MITHGSILALLKALNYVDKKAKGACNGLADRGEVDFLDGDFKRFITHIKELKDHKVEDLVREDKASFDEKLLPDTAKKNFYRHKLALPKLAFLQSVALSQAPGRFVDFLPANLAQADLSIISRLYAPQSLMRKGGIVSVDSFLCIYNVNELNQFLNLLDTTIGEWRARNQNAICPDFAFGIKFNKHSIAACYSGGTNTWVYLNANQLELLDLSYKHNQLAKIIFSGYVCSTSFMMEMYALIFNQQLINDNLLFAIRVDTTYDQKDIVIEIMQNLREKINARNLQGITVAKLAKDFQDKARIRDMVVRFGGVSEVDLLADAKCDFKLPMATNLTAIHMAMVANRPPAVIAALTKHGLNIHEYSNGHAAIHIASRSFPHMIKTLVALGADAKQVTNKQAGPSVTALGLSVTNETAIREWIALGLVTDDMVDSIAGVATHGKNMTVLFLLFENNIFLSSACKALISRELTKQNPGFKGFINDMTHFNNFSIIERKHAVKEIYSFLNHSCSDARLYADAKEFQGNQQLYAQYRSALTQLDKCVDQLNAESGVRIDEHRELIQFIGTQYAALSQAIRRHEIPAKLTINKIPETMQSSLASLIGWPNTMLVGDSKDMPGAPATTQPQGAQHAQPASKAVNVQGLAASAAVAAPAAAASVYAPQRFYRVIRKQRQAAPSQVQARQDADTPCGLRRRILGRDGM